MKRTILFFVGSLSLAGCAGFGADPLDDVPRFSDVAVDAEAGEVAATATPSAPGFFARLLGGNDADAATDVQAAITDEQPADDVTEAAEDVSAAAPESAGLGGLFARLGSAGASNNADTAPEPGTVAPMTAQPFGEVGRTCGLSTRDLGTKIYGASGYAIYDTAPNTTSPRPHYLTGFNDGCVRQFTAALVLNGDVGTHEVVRYKTAQARRPYTQVDEAYEALKSRFCGVGRGQPCGGRIDRLARNTTFITGYAQFVSSPVWIEILLHDGDVLAVNTESK